MTVYYNQRTDKIMIGEPHYYPRLLALRIPCRGSLRWWLVFYVSARAWVEIGEF